MSKAEYMKILFDTIKDDIEKISLWGEGKMLRVKDKSEWKLIFREGIMILLRINNLSPFASSIYLTFCIYFPWGS